MATIRPLPKSAFVVHLPETDFNRARLASYLRRCTYRSRIGNEKSLIEQLSGLGHFPGRELYKMPVIRTSGSKCRSFSAIPYPRPRTDFVWNPGFLAVRGRRRSANSQRPMESGSAPDDVTALQENGVRASPLSQAGATPRSAGPTKLSDLTVFPKAL